MISTVFLLAILFIHGSVQQVHFVTNENHSVSHIEDKTYWDGIALSELNLAFKRKNNDGVAKNVIIFVGDGMGMSTITASRIFQGQTKDGWGETSSFSFESFPITGLSKTYNINKQTADSASTATALFSGVKTTQNVLGLDMQAPYNTCDLEQNRKAKVSSIMTWAQNKNKATGIVTTTALTDATPAATYAHVNYRYWDCDSKIPHNLRYCMKDIARQLVEDAPGKNFKVILGGGRGPFGNLSEEITSGSCHRTDGKNLVSEWRKNKGNASYVTTADQLTKIDHKRTDHLLGLFAPGHLNFVGENEPTRPSLKLMTTKAIDILSKNKNGFFLMVEAGRIDQAHHKNYAKLALMETVEFSEAIAAAVASVNIEETLIIVTADHSHPFTMAGYSDRGNDILGFADSSDESFYQTLTYANGPGAEYHRIKPDSTNCTKSKCSPLEHASTTYVKDVRNDPNRTTDVHYQASSSVFLVDDTHGGEDVPIYAQGPKAHLLSGVHEQNYIAHVISCAACVGPQENNCCQSSQKGKNKGNTINNIWITTIITPLLTYIIFG